MADGTPPPAQDPLDLKRDELLTQLAKAVLHHGDCLRTMNTKLEGQARDIEDFRSLADAFARFIGEAKS